MNATQSLTLTPAPDPDLPVRLQGDPSALPAEWGIRDLSLFCTQASGRRAGYALSLDIPSARQALSDTPQTEWKENGSFSYLRTPGGIPLYAFVGHRVLHPSDRHSAVLFRGAAHARSHAHLFASAMGAPMVEVRLMRGPQTAGRLAMCAHDAEAVLQRAFAGLPLFLHTDPAGHVQITADWAQAA